MRAARDAQPRARTLRCVRAGGLPAAGGALRCAYARAPACQARCAPMPSCAPSFSSTSSLPVGSTSTARAGPAAKAAASGTPASSARSASRRPPAAAGAPCAEQRTGSRRRDDAAGRAACTARGESSDAIGKAAGIGRRRRWAPPAQFGSPTRGRAASGAAGRDMATRQMAAAVVAGGGVLLAAARTALCDSKGDRVVRNPPRLSQPVVLYTASPRLTPHAAAMRRARCRRLSTRRL